MFRLLFFVVLGFFLGCAHRHGLRTVEEARALRGLNRAEVEARMGPANDQDSQGRLYWFLNQDSPNNPQPTPVLYEFIFQNGLLQSIKRYGEQSE